MKKLLLLTLIFLFTIACTSAANFTSTWNTSATGGYSNTTTIILPLQTTGSYNFTVWWGDGTSSLINTINASTALYTVNHTYATAGIKEINMSGNITGFRFNNGGDDVKLLNVTTWGDLNVGNLGGYFYGCTNFKDVTGIDNLNLTGTTNLDNMFYQCRSFNGNISGWNTENVTIMSDMFNGFSDYGNFNQNISGWKVGSVTDMSRMFNYQENFTQDLNNWDVGNVTTMESMFRLANNFNRNISGWNVGNVTDMEGMFNGATNFNQNLSNWNVGKVTTMHYMFSGATNFNGDVSNWKVGKVGDMEHMFHSCTNFNQDLSNWDVGNVSDMDEMFRSAVNFNRNISGWNVGNVTDMEGMFNGATNFNQNLSNWNVGKVTTMQFMFKSASSFNGNISNWNVENVTNMSQMFYLSSVFNQNLSDWNTGKVTQMDFMFTDTDRFNGNISNWNVGNVTTMSYMFSRADSFNQNINNWNMGNVKDISKMFQYSNYNLNLSDWNVGNVTDMSLTFYQASLFNSNISSWNTENVTTFANTFYEANSFNQDISNWKVGKATSINSMFYGADSFNQNLSDWDTGNVTLMGTVFVNAISFNGNITKWNTGNVTTMGYMFDGATSFNQNLSNWNTTSVTTMEGMFTGVTLSTSNYDSLLVGWSSHVQKNAVPFHAGNSLYTASAARNVLTGTYLWTITDKGYINDTVNANFNFTTPVNENTTQTFRLNLSMGSNVSNITNVNFTWNGTTQTITSANTTFGNETSNYSSTFTIPWIPTPQQNVTMIWNYTITYNNGTTANGNFTMNQTVNRLNSTVLFTTNQSANPIYEMSYVIFYLNTSLNEGVRNLSDVYFIWNTTNYGATRINDTLYYVIQDIGLGNYSVPWVWNYTINHYNGSNTTTNTSGNVTSVRYQNISRTITGLTDVLTQNLLMRDEDSGEIVNGTIQGLLYYTLKGGNSSYVKNVSYDVNATNISFYKMNNSDTYLVSSTVYYESAYYSPRTLIYDDSEWSNTSTNVTLYLANSTGTTPVLFQVTDLTGTPQPNTIVNIQKLNPVTATYSVVESLLTNFDGEAISLSLKLYNDTYKFVVIQDGITYLITDPTQILKTTIVLKIDKNTIIGSSWPYGGWTSTLTVDPVTYFVTWDYTDTSSTFQEACLKVFVETAQKTDWYCYTCRTVPSAIIQCDPGTIIANGTFHAEGWMNTTTARSENLMDSWITGMDTGYLLYGTKGVLASVLIVGTLAGIGITLGAGWGLLLTCVGLIFVTLIGFVKIGWVPLVLLIGIAIMLAYKMRN